jgi:hypothetical protein
MSLADIPSDIIYIICPTFTQIGIVARTSHYFRRICFTIKSYRDKVIFFHEYPLGFSSRTLIECFRMAAIFGYIHILDYLYGLSNCDSYIATLEVALRSGFVCAVQGHNVLVIQWFIDHKRLRFSGGSAPNELYYAPPAHVFKICKYVDISLLKIIIPEWLSTRFDTSIGISFIQLILWHTMRSLNYDKIIYVQSMLERWFLESCLNFDNLARYFNSLSDRFDLLNEAFIKFCQHNRVDLVDWIISIYGKYIEVNYLADQLFYNACISKNITLAKWFHTYYVKNNIKPTLKYDIIDELDESLYDIKLWLKSHSNNYLQLL